MGKNEHIHEQKPVREAHGGYSRRRAYKSKSVSSLLDKTVADERSDDPFQPKLTKMEARRQETDHAAQIIIQTEQENMRKKTAKLRAQRLSKERTS